jgi:hypothetical protein
MKAYSHIFRNKGLGEYNDDVFEDAVFELIRYKYTFLITPSDKTTYWRFGFAFSKEKDFQFNPNLGRYNNQDLKFVEIDVGSKDGEGQWISGNILWLGSYYIEGFIGQPKPKKGYVSFSEVKVELQAASSNFISAAYTSGSITDNALFPIKDYPYFKAFAWADGVEFELDCTILSEEDTGNFEPIDTNEPANNFSIKDNFDPVLEVKELAKELASLLLDLDDKQGNMFGIFGKWGRGKTYLWNKLWEEIERQGKQEKIAYVKVDFHAWKYQDTPASWAYLYETLADKYFLTNHYHSFLLNNTEVNISFTNIFFWLGQQLKKLYAASQDRMSTICRRLKLNATRLGVRKIVVFFVGLIITVIWLIFISFSLKLKWAWYLTCSIGVLTTIKIIYIYAIYKPKALKLLKEYGSKISFQKHLGLQAEIQKEIIYLLTTWIESKTLNTQKLVLFVDDIDRCSEERIIQVVDALKVMLEEPEIAKRMLILVALDERVLKMAIRFKYHQFISEDNRDLDNQKALDETKSFLNTVTKEYIDKLFIGGIRLGALNYDERLIMLDNITKGKIKGYSVGGFDQTFSRDFEHNDTNSKSPLVNFETIATEIVFPTADNTEISKDEYTMLRQVLARFNEGTPRSIKIFYYRFLLAKRVLNYKLNRGSKLHGEWSELKSNKIMLPYLILSYTLNTGNKTFEDEYKSLEGKPTEESMNIEVFSLTFSLSRGLYFQLLKIVEMVVPY